MTAEPGAPSVKVEADDSNTVTSNNTQTRFSFYNAQDYMVSKPPSAEQQQQAPSNRFHFYNAQEMSSAMDQNNATAATSAQHSSSSVVATPGAAAAAAALPKANGAAKDKNRGAVANDLDSVEILRSLQEHEQQRLEILGTEPTTPKHHHRGAAGVATTPTSSSAVASAAVAASPGGDGSASNPYEDAIKEALELLRKHRSGSNSEQELLAGTEGGGAAAAPSSRPPDLDTRFAAPRYSPPSSSVNMIGTQSAVANNTSEPQHLTAESISSMIKAPRDSDAGSSSAAAAVSHTSSVLDTLLKPTTPAGGAATTPSEAHSGATPTSEGALGEAYQAEIEARRKQRQERMARYASRLAELKQDSGGSNNNEDKDTTSSEPFSPVQHQLPQQVDGSHRSSSAAARTKLTAADAVSPGGRSDVWRETGQSPTALLNISSTLSQATSQDEEVQRGVERVLLAILERANNSRGRAAAAAAVTTTTADTASASSTAASSYRQPEEEKKAEPINPVTSVSAAASSDEEDDALLRAMSELMRSAPSVQGSSSELDLHQQETTTQQQHHHHHHDGDASHATQDSGTLAAAAATADLRQVASDPQAHQELDLMVERIFSTKGGDGAAAATSVAAAAIVNDDDEDDGLTELLNSKSGGDDDDEDDSAARDGSGSGSEGGRHHRSGGKADHSKKKSISEEYTDGDSDDEYTDEDSDDESDLEATSGGSYDEADSETDNEGRSDVLNGVLGPLSMMAGGTTGVVLEADSSEDSAPASSSVLDAISSVAMNLVGVNSSSSKDKRYATSDDEEEDDESASSSSSSEESETRELTRTLCAHIFPKEMPGREQLQSRIPKWDESNPDEPGYRIIRLNSYQLKSVQMEFDYLIKEWKRKSGRGKRSPEPLDDESFERDLKEAEDLLDREERRAAKAGKKETATATTEGHKTATDDAGATEPVACLDQFPGVRPAGKGEMGDLEYFHLPVIFKSHVTGFEPTKDLHLEAGNVVAGQYLVEGELGSAAFSTAYRCVDLSSEGDGPDGHDEVCLKVIKNTKDFFDQSLDEIKILELLRQTGQCSENHILEMKTFFYHREHLIIVTELLRQNLFEFGKFIIDNDEEPYFTIPRLGYITRQVLMAMKFIHNIGLVHSDVKPENILLSSYSRAQVKLIDFGSSCYLTDRQSSYIQSRSYRAPEVVLGLPYDGRIDIWSLGCVVAEMFTGEVTFQNDSVVSMLSRIEGICGKTPTHMIEQGRQSGAFFSSCGLLFEKIEKKSSRESGDAGEDDEDSRKPNSYDIFQPKRTTLAARLGFERDLMEKFDSGAQLSREQKKRAVFVDFVRSLLTIDPDHRPTAEEALKHPWMEYAAGLTEADIKYPSE